VRVVLMTAIGVTDRRTAAHDWKGRGERLVRRSGGRVEAGPSARSMRRIRLVSFEPTLLRLLEIAPFT